MPVGIPQVSTPAGFLFYVQIGSHGGLSVFRLSVWNELEVKFFKTRQPLFLLFFSPPCSRPVSARTSEPIPVSGEWIRSGALTQTAGSQCVNLLRQTGAILQDTRVFAPE